jgi:hypothetical protein
MFEEGEEITALDNVHLYKDLSGNTVKALGGWKDPERATHFSAAINAVHEAHSQEGIYHEPCMHCVDLNKDNTTGISIGCNHHRGNVSISVKIVVIIHCHH